EGVPPPERAGGARGDPEEGPVGAPRILEQHLLAVPVEGAMPCGDETVAAQDDVSLAAADADGKGEEADAPDAPAEVDRFEAEEGPRAGEGRSVARPRLPRGEDDPAMAEEVVAEGEAPARLQDLLGGDADEDAGGTSLVADVEEVVPVGEGGGQGSERLVAGDADRPLRPPQGRASPGDGKGRARLRGPAQEDELRVRMGEGVQPGEAGSERGLDRGRLVFGKAQAAPRAARCPGRCERVAALADELEIGKRGAHGRNRGRDDITSMAGEGEGTMRKIPWVWAEHFLANVQEDRTIGNGGAGKARLPSGVAFGRGFCSSL